MRLIGLLPTPAMGAGGPWKTQKRARALQQGLPVSVYSL